MIGFLQPLLLAALPLAALPLLLHLMARRDPPTVSFPAVRYLAEATREHQRRLKLRHWLLLLLRSLLILALVLAAAGPTLPSGSPGAHAPAALVVILDNSPSSAAVDQGEPVLESLRRAANRALDGATASDAVWLMTAGAAPVRGAPAQLRDVVDSVTANPRRLDLGAALAEAGRVLATDARPGAVLLLSDLQAAALTGAEPRRPVVVGRPEGAAPPNRGLTALGTSPQPWTADGGIVRIAATGDTAAAPVRVRLGDLPPRQVLLGGGHGTELTLPAPAPGWWPLEASLAPDELRLDDVAHGVVRVLPPAAVRWDPADRHLDAALSVLVEGGRVRAGTEVQLGDPGPGASVVFPPTDPARLGAVNRALAARGSGWRFGQEIGAPARADSGGLVAGTDVLRRLRLVPEGSGRTGILASVGGEPWIVQDGDLVLVGSRMIPEWTDLPVRAGFVPLLDALVNRIVRGDVALERGLPGEAVTIPDRVDGVRRGEDRWGVEGGARFVPPALGLYALEAGSDTLGVLAVNPDPRESDLRRATREQVRAVWGPVRLLEPMAAADAVFGEAARTGLRGPLLWLAGVLALCGIALAGRTPHA